MSDDPFWIRERTHKTNDNQSVYSPAVLDGALYPFIRSTLMNTKTCVPNLLKSIALLLLILSFVAACGDSGNESNAENGTNSETDPPTVQSHAPLTNATSVAINPVISATFSKAMDPVTLTTTTFTLSAGATAIPGTVIYANSTATFLPTVHLTADTEFTARITTGAESSSGVALAGETEWRFTTGSTLAPELPVDLGRAGDYAILAKSGISTVPESAITGDIGVSPAAATYITGFSLTADSSDEFSTATQVTGNVYAATYSAPTPSKLTTAVGDMELAYTSAAGRAAGVTELGAGNIGGMTLDAGVYNWGTGLLIPTDITLDGSSTDVWIFQIAQDLTVSSATSVTLSGGALAKNVFWQVAGQVNLGTTAHLEGIILSQTDIILGTGASVNGRLFAQTAVELDGSTVVKPAE